MCKEEATSALAGFRAGRLFWLNWNLECWFLWREENRRTRRKVLGARTRTNNKTQPTHCREASALTIAPSLLSKERM